MASSTVNWPCCFLSQVSEIICPFFNGFIGLSPPPLVYRLHLYNLRTNFSSVIYVGNIFSSDGVLSMIRVTNIFSQPVAYLYNFISSALS